ncbi:hypothetical protein [Streptomyces eurythermus]
MDGRVRHVGRAADRELLAQHRYDLLAEDVELLQQNSRTASWEFFRMNTCPPRPTVASSGRS